MKLEGAESNPSSEEAHEWDRKGAAIEAVSGAACERRVASVKARVGGRRGRNIGRVAAARHLLTLVHYGMRDGHIRCLATTDAA